MQLVVGTAVAITVSAKMPRSKAFTVPACTGKCQEIELVQLQGNSEDLDALQFEASGVFAIA